MVSETRYWEDVEEGLPLQGFSYELSLARLVAAVRATGLYDFVHFDRDYARAVGARDAFISTPHMSGLFGRLLSDWSGPEGDLRALSFSMTQPCCAGDLLAVTGKVGRKYRSESGAYLVDMVDLNVAHGTAPHAATGAATLALPSRHGGPVSLPDASPALEIVQPDPAMPPAAREMLGRVHEGHSHSARLTAEQILLWCECLEDWNPLYWDEAYAASSRYGGIIAPPQSQFLGAGAAVPFGIGHGQPGASVPAALQSGLRGLDLQKQLRKDHMAAGLAFSLPGFPEVAVVHARTTYHTPLRPGDSTHTSQELVNCSGLKQTRLGQGYFVTMVRTIRNQRDEVVRTTTMTLFEYRVAKSH